MALKLYQLRRPVPCVLHGQDAVLGAGHLDIHCCSIIWLVWAGMLCVSYVYSSSVGSKKDLSTIKNHREQVCMGNTEDTDDITEITENLERVDGVGTLLSLIHI